MTAVLWDIDGTLVSSRGAVARMFLDAVEAACGIRPDPTGLDFGGRLDPEIAELLVRAVGANLSQVDPVLAQFEALVTAGQDTLRPHISALPGAVEVLSTLAQAGVKQTVVTGNLESVGRFKLDAAGLVPPLDVALAGFGASGVDRATVGQVALNRLVGAGWTGSPDTCWVVGDTPRDLACARALGLRCALVATGHHSVESLTLLGPDLVLPALTEKSLWRGAWFD
jgi:phosphoglycolate phosphatase-like HAD superfamily hydrolase